MTPVPLTVTVRGRLSDLQPAMRRVGEYVLADPSRASAMTITDLASACHTSEATVIRFCRELGLRGYPQFRLALAAEMGLREGSASAPAPSGDISPGDDLASVIEKIAFADARAVEDTARSLSVVELEAVVDTIVTAPRVDIYGVGASGFVAADLQQKLHRIGRVAFAFPDAHLALMSAALLGPGDVAIGISHTGTTYDTLDAVRVAAEHGATTVALTNAPRSPLATAADHVLRTAARETTFRSGATASRLAQLTVVDCVFVAVAQRTYEQSQAALEKTYDAVRDRRSRPPR
ncbi:MAG TPA: MurR/RpiR family transcriptional regulator [Cellulomonas sp.]